MRFLHTTLFCLFLSTANLFAQQLTHRLGYLLVQVEPDIDLTALIADHSAFFQSEIRIDRTISTRMAIFLVQFDHSVIHQGQLLDRLRSDSRVRIAQYDHITTQRNLPNDPLLNNQWQWLNTGQTGGLVDADIDADRAWNISTGGVTALGDTIVVAVVDDGLDYNHVDIAANTWINYHEIDGNGIDDDDNGYIDDIYGWNAYAEAPDVFGQNHGLSVAGMIGAVGNNNVGITGINWNVKLMTIIGGSPESAAIASYAYALEQRILYNETNGEKGAFVVSTNSSWGIDFGQPADAPLWCAFYDSLGQHGILSAAATANRNIDIDVVSDLPTGCPSEYLLSVTALNASNERTFSAWGLTTIDFGAPGADVYTTDRNDAYENTSGTSFASPIAAGFVALLYSAPCPGFAMFSRTDPAGAAAFVRDMIFQGVKPIDGLEAIIRFGGSLNAGNSMERMMAFCTACPVAIGVNADTISDTLAIISWSLIDTADAVNARIRPVGSADWDTIPDVVSPLTLTGLVGCTDYEIEFESICADTSTGFQNTYVFKTEGCCELPADIVLTVDGQTFHAQWSSVLAADYYVVQWRPQGEEEWTEEAVATTEITVPDLEPCTYYEVRLQTSCDTTATGFSEIQTIRTKGCGNCIDLEYCASASLDASMEFIDSLIIGPLVNHSGNNGGYVFFEGLNPVFVAGDSYSIWVRPGFGGPFTFDEQFRIWIDYNQNGIFDSLEMVLDSVLLTTDESLLVSFTVPDTIIPGSTRMRVSMAYTDSTPPTNQPPCGDLDYGEVEDYCIELIRRPDECAAIDTLLFDAISFTGAFMYWYDVDDAIAYTYRWREVGTTEYSTEVATIDTTANLTDLEKCKAYEVQIRTICTFDTTSYNVNYILETDCDVAVNDPEDLLSSVTVFPNPATDVVRLRMNSTETGDHRIMLYNLQGQRLMQQIHFAEAGQTEIIQLGSMDPYPPGLYVIVVSHGNKASSTKLLKM